MIVFFSNDGLSKIILLKCYVVIWIHVIQQIQDESSARSTFVARPFMAICLVPDPFCSSNQRKTYRAYHKPTFLLHECFCLDAMASRNLRGFVDDYSSGFLLLRCRGEKRGKFELLVISCSSKPFLYYFHSSHKKELMFLPLLRKALNSLFASKVTFSKPG